jgi:hypothetical protein
MRLIDADALGDKVADLYSEGEEATEGDKVVNDVIDLIDNAPTIDNLSEYSDKLWQKAYERGKAEERPQGDFTIDELKKWLYEIAYNNTNNDFGKYCVEIVDRLNGFKRFVADMRKEAENEI